jgi:hypothetical protein
MERKCFVGNANDLYDQRVIGNTDADSGLRSASLEALSLASDAPPELPMRPAISLRPKGGVRLRVDRRPE